LAPFASSFLDAALVQWNAWGPDGFWQVWRIRLFSNVLATLTLVPPIVALGNTEAGWLRSVSRRRMLEAGVLVATLLFICASVFTNWLPPARVSPALLYAPLP